MKFGTTTSHNASTTVHTANGHKVEPEATGFLVSCSPIIKSCKLQLNYNSGFLGYSPLRYCQEDIMPAKPVSQHCTFFGASRTDFVIEERDLVIIGGGVAGYVAAIKAGQEGLKVRTYICQGKLYAIDLTSILGLLH
jgi:hypothetical protein